MIYEKTKITDPISQGDIFYYLPFAHIQLDQIAEVREDGTEDFKAGWKKIQKGQQVYTNILMEPNDQYLCIVPDRGGKGVTENVFLPFEGDSGLSVILSKAMLLAEDDKITDVTITRQIKWK